MTKKMQDLPNYDVSCHVGARESVTLMMYGLGAEEVMRGESLKRKESEKVKVGTNFLRCQGHCRLDA